MLNTLRKYNYTKGHCYILKNNIVYIPILKNASTTIEGALESTYGINKREFTTYDKVENVEKYIIILRNPVDRWISGYLQDKSNDGIHTLPQTSFLDFDYIDKNKCLFFYLNSSETKFSNVAPPNNIIERINKVTGLSIKYVPPGNAKESFLKEQLKDSIDISFIKDRYKEDYNLIERVELF